MRLVGATEARSDAAATVSPSDAQAHYGRLVAIMFDRSIPAGPATVMKIARKDVTVQTRRGYLAPPAVEDRM